MLRLLPIVVALVLTSPAENLYTKFTRPFYVK